MQLLAVKQNGWAIGLIDEQTPELCLAAVKENGWVIKDVKVQTPEICLAAIKFTRGPLNYIDMSIFDPE